MLHEFTRAFDEGKTGWDNKNLFHNIWANMMVEFVKGPKDSTWFATIANYMAMLWNMWDEIPEVAQKQKELPLKYKPGLRDIPVGTKWSREQQEAMRSETSE